MAPSSNTLIPNHELKDFLDFKANQYENVNFIQTDPIQIPKKFKTKEDIEIIAFIMAIIAWGNRKSIIKSGEKLIDIVGVSPLDFVLNYKSKKKQNLHFIHRTFNGVDLDFFFRSLQNIYTKYGGLENCFFANSPKEQNLFHRIMNFRDIFTEVQHPQRSLKHLANPSAKSACKRIVMYLRWMVRSNEKGVDFGMWKSISSSELMVPLDIHTANISRKLLLLHRKQNDWSSNIELRNQLLKFDPTDPAKYDFALFGLGAFENF